jgi:hypothetical protein
MLKPRHQVCISLDASLQARLDAVLPRYDRARMRRCTRAEFARTALTLLIEEEERRDRGAAVEAPRWSTWDSVPREEPRTRPERIVLGWVPERKMAFWGTASDLEEKWGNGVTHWMPLPSAPAQEPPCLE